MLSADQLIARHKTLFNLIATHVYKLLSEELTEEEKNNSQIAALTIITILRLAAKLAIKVNFPLKEFLIEAEEVYNLELTEKSPLPNKESSLDNLN